MNKGLFEEATGTDGGGGGESWFAGAGLSEDALGNEALTGHLARYDGLESALKGGFEAKQALSKKTEGMIKLPGEDASDDERNAFYQQMGRPESADKYTWQAPEGKELDADSFAEYQKKFFEEGFSDKNFQFAMNAHLENEQAKEAQYQEYQANLAKETEATLKNEWGNEYPDNIKAALKVAESYKIVDALKETGLINHASIVKMLHGVALSTREGDIQGKTGGSGDTLESLKQHPGWHDKTHPEHNALIQRSIELRSAGAS